MIIFKCESFLPESYFTSVNNSTNYSTIEIGEENIIRYLPMDSNSKEFEDGFGRYVKSKNLKLNIII